jgi:hypothetical protein
LLGLFAISKPDKHKLAELFKNTNSKNLTRIELDEIIAKHIPELAAKKNMYIRVCESLAIGHYHEQCEYTPVKYLLTDDAPEYQKIAVFSQALCWVHDARAYKKSTPFIEIHKQIINNFKQEYWGFYNNLLAYKKIQAND